MANINVSKPYLGEEEIKNVVEVMRSGMLAQGKNVKELERRWAEMCGAKEAVAVNSGTAAIHASLYAMGIKKGMEVITVPFTFVASSNPILMQGAKVVFCDVKEDTFCIDPEAVKEKITKKTKAILGVDLYGQVYDYKALREIAQDHKLLLHEDACQAVGAQLDGKTAGTFGDTTSFSLYATKNIMTGEGGMLTTDSPEMAEQARRFRHHGQSEQTRYEYYDLGYNYRMMDLQAAIGLAQLDRLPEFTRKRQENAAALTEGLSKIKGIKTPYVMPGAKHVFHQYTIKVEKDFPLSRDKLKDHLNSKGVGSGVYYPKPLHLHKIYRDMGYKEGDFPVSEALSQHVLSLPVHPSLSKADITTIIDAFKL